MQSRSGGANNKVSATYITLQEGFLLFQVDLNKLQVSCSPSSGESCISSLTGIAIRGSQCYSILKDLEKGKQCPTLVLTETDLYCFSGTNHQRYNLQTAETLFKH